MNPPLVVPSFHESNWSNPFKKDTVFISRHFLQSSIITRSQWLIWENLKGVFIWGKPLSPCSFKSDYLFHRTSCTVVQLPLSYCVKYTKTLATIPFSFDNVTTAIAVIHYARVTFGTATFSKELLVRSTYSLNFLSGHCSFWEQLLLRRSVWSIKLL